MNRTDHNLAIDIADEKRRTWRLRECRRRLKPRCHRRLNWAPWRPYASTGLNISWRRDLLGAFMVSACVFGALYEFPQSPVHQAILSRMLRRLLMGMSMGLTAVGNYLFAVGKTVGRPHQPIGYVYFFPAGQNQGLGCGLLYNCAVHWRGAWSASGRAFPG